jgi:protoporphyrinogen/coproporphyrinogen III oxidase
MPHVTVIGGGVTGLAAAFRLSRQPGLEVTLLEAGEDLGGKIQTLDLAGARVELAADAFLARDQRPLQLCAEIGLSSELVEPSDFGAWIYREGGLARLEAGTVLGFPASASSILGSRVLSRRGKARALLEALNPTALRGPDVAVASFARKRFGRQVLERLVDPLLSGTRGGDLHEISLAAALPQVDQAARNHRSLMSGLSAASGRVAAPRFLAPRGGMHRLIEALQDALGDVAIEREHSVRSVVADHASYVVGSASGEIRTDGIVLSVPSHAAARLVEGLSHEAALGLGRIRHAASAVINLVFPQGAVAAPPDGSGVLIPSSEAMTLTGCSWFSNKWPALTAPGRQTVRCFIGRGAHDPALDLPDRDLVGVVLEELRQVVDVSGEPIATHVTRWDAGLPIYEVGHLERVAAIERSLAHHPRVQLAEASLRGSGIPDCISQAEGAAARLLASLRG